MAKGQDIKRRIKSITSMLQVTKAMELISSIKMRKAQEAALRSKHYVFESWRAILQLKELPENKDNIYLTPRTEGRILALVVASDRGLAGSYNTDILKSALKFIEKNGLENIDFITMGNKVKSFLKKLGANIVADFPLGQTARFTFTSPIALIAWDGFTLGEYKKFISIHTHFDSAVKKSATSLQILPISGESISHLKEESNETQAVDEYKFEPSQAEAMGAIIRQTVRALTYQVVLESEAAEQASRMIAMKNASDAASDLKKDFEFTFNQVRQQSITAELAEISAGAMAQE